MALRVEKRDGTGERTVLTTMMVSRAVLGAVAAKWEPPGLFSSRWSNIAGGWAVKHYHRYRKAPGRDIQGYFDAWAESGRDKETVELLDTFLSGLSDEYERIKKNVSPDYILDKASVLFNRVRADRLREEIAADLEVGDVSKCLEKIHSFREVEVGAASGIDVLADKEAVASAFEQRGEVLVQYPGALGEFFGTALGRDQFVSLVGKAKVGKSFWLQDICFRGVEQGRNVAYFECGDSSQHQVLRRLASRAAAKPVDPCRYYWPTSVEPGVTRGLPEMGTELRESETPLTPEEAMEAFDRLANGGDASRFKLSCHPNSSLTVRQAESTLEGWERDGWRPDVVCFDYADILAPMDGKVETREQIDATWKCLRALSQRWHCLVVTATQSDTDGYDARILKRSNFSGSRTKNDHVTAEFGINQTDQEKDAGLYRLNAIACRDLAFSEERCAWVASCLAVCQAAVISTF